MPYLPNLASPSHTIYQKSMDALLEEIERCDVLGIRYIVTHIGSHAGSGKESGRLRLIQALGQAADEGDPMILLENDSGSGGHMGSNFGYIADLLNDLGSKKLGFCLDTCHTFAAGYNIATEDGLAQILQEIKGTIGFNRLKLIHLNDSVGELSSGVDHHDHIGLGKIGEDGFRRILRSQLVKRPMIMETPMDGRRSNAENMYEVRDLAGLSR